MEKEKREKESITQKLRNNDVISLFFHFISLCCCSHHQTNISNNNNIKEVPLVVKEDLKQRGPEWWAVF